MRTRFALSLPVLLAAVLCSAGARADDKAVRKALQAEYERMNQAFKKKDLKTIREMVAPNFIWKEADGTTMSGEEVMTQAQQQMAATKSVEKMRVTITKLTVKGGQAVAVVENEIRSTIAGPQGKTQTLESSFTTRDFWTQTPKGWRIKRVEAIKGKTLIDGKPVSSNR